MIRIYRFLMVLGLLVWMAQNVSSQSRYDKDKLYNVFPAKVSNKVLGYDKGSSVILKSLSKDDQKQQWNINELSGSFRLVNVFEDKALRADVDHKALAVTEVNGSDEAQLWSIQETANGVRLAPANTPSLMLVCQKDGRLQLMDRKKAETMEASLFQIRVSAVPMPERAGMVAREKVYWEDETRFEENKEAGHASYRDSRTEGMPEEFFSKVDVKAHYAESGTQVMAINTLFQLYAMKKEDNAQLKVADKLLFMPDLFSYYLTGVANNEYSIASTSELLDAKARTWNFKLIRELGLPEHLFGEVVMPGTSRGFLKPEIKEQIGVDYEVEVIAVASHDTASAASVVPLSAKGEKVAFLSSGTWSLLGVMSDEPILTEEARLAGFTNEGGSDGKICFLQNITGLWILQKLMQEWKEEGKDVAYSTLLPAAEMAETDALIDVDDTTFQCPVSMAEAITNYCIAHQQTPPSTQGEFVKCVLRSLALRYKTGMEALNQLLPEPVTKLYVIGGGSQNKYLNRLTEEAIGIPVVEGPVEATAIGNIRQQMK